MKSILNISNIYILLWCLYSLQGALYAKGSIISQSILAILMLISLYYFAMVNILKVKTPIVLHILSILIVIFSIYGVIYILSGHVNALGSMSFDYLKEIYMSLLPIYPFYIFSRQGNINERTLRIWTPIFFLVAFAGYYTASIDINATYATQQEMDNEMTNNAGYLFLSLIPITMIYKDKPIIQYSLLAIALVFIIFAMKRGAILIAGVCLLWIMYYSYKNGSVRRKFSIIILSLVLLIGLSYLIMHLYTENEYFVSRIENTIEGDSSERDVIFSTLYNYYIYETSVLQFMFGSGANATVDIAGNYAHNDWLEIAVDNGFVCVILYLIYWIYLLRTCHNAKSNLTQYMIISLFFIITFLETIFSMSFNSIPIYLSIAMAWALSSMQNLSKENEETI